MAADFYLRGWRWMDEDERFMEAALTEAAQAAAIGEVPVGAVVTQGQKIVGRGYNLREASGDPTAHAEIIALREASARLGNWRLEGTTIYVTLEPCPMCAGALVLARIDRLVFGVRDPKAGACGSLMNIVQDPRLNHRLTVTEGILEERCREALVRFFRARRT